MSEEVIAEVPAPEQVATAAPEPEIAAPEAAPEVESKVFTQEDLDAAIGKTACKRTAKVGTRSKAGRSTKARPCGAC
jgi:hypothetical protein